MMDLVNIEKPHATPPFPPSPPPPLPPDWSGAYRCREPAPVMPGYRLPDNALLSRGGDRGAVRTPLNNSVMH